jgi:phosphoenolpyruvate-protein phosphotransferase
MGGKVNGMTQAKEVIFQGRGISPGLAQGRTYVYRDILQRNHKRYGIEEGEIELERQRIDSTMKAVLSDLAAAANHIERELDKSHADILRVQQAFIRDPQLWQEITEELESERVNAEEAIKRVLRRMQRRLASMDSSSERDPGDDVADLSRRLLRHLSGAGDHALENLPSGSVIVATRLLPSQTVLLSRNAVAAVVLEEGGTGSHAALLTREMGLPAVSGVPDAVRNIPPDASLLVDGTRGSVTLYPTSETKAVFQRALTANRAQYARSRSRCIEAVRTPDGEPVRVMANIGCSEHARLARECGADGIGLYRLEQFYLAQQHPPDEETLLRALRSTLKPLQDRPVTVRLLDAGGDKHIPFMDLPEETNPFLGRRGVRLLRDYPDITRTQLGALLTLSQETDLRILIPMVCLTEDIDAMREMLGDLAERRGMPAPPLGAMIETPVAALCADCMAASADFLSIGTNDLTQYTMAADRENQGVDRYYRDDHPAILQLLRQVLSLCGSTPISICGELAARSDVTAKLIAIGFRDFSVAPFMIPMVKAAIRSLETPVDG